MAKLVADQIVEMLANAGVKRLYAVTGDSLNHLNDAIRRDGRIQWIHVRHEEVGAYAAGAEAQLNGLGCCAGSSGPGHVHLVNGLYDAHRSGAPVIAIASTCATDEFGMGYFQETNTIKLFDDCSCYNQVAATAGQVPKMLQAALQHAVHKRGVAVFGLPGDVAAEDAKETTTATKIYQPNPIVRPSDSEITALAELLNSESKICIFCGLGAVEAHDDVIALSRLLKAPVAYSFRAKMGIQHNNPYEVGMTGLLGIASAYKSMHEADVVLLLGTDFPYTPFLPENNKVVQIDIRPERLGRRIALEMGLCGDVGDTLKALLPLLKEKTDQGYLDAMVEFYKEVQVRMQTYVEDKGKEDAISPEFVAAVLNKLAAVDAIFTVDTGMTNVWTARYLEGTGQRVLLGSFVHGSMANAMPQAIGAALARPGREVIALCGDGGLSMLLGDLVTIKQYQLPVKVIVFNNRSLGMVKLEMEVAGLPDWQTDMVNPDFAAVAEAMGIKGFSVRKPEDLENTLSMALQTPGPVLVNIFTNPTSLAMPPKIEFSQMKGFALWMSKLILGGRYDEVFDAVKSNYKHIRDISI
ncbi:pyruvate dehydrogenase (quinone) [Chitinophaga terrae (ex Kim and Jung 2007)]|uniref:Pyruvate dehydrogenase (Quinone) n=1 Tax=Chitinophaga terrae (ex Kim and Jung 2007) TaxID=408074 RepID=A0A1H4E9M1_9BACT|nr:thiamine pyrophosphate-dependent enzyme [Chitinophaga terrae (ex Kim and Jung 2007)]GEP91486.1 pyruvate dehydrogenase [Chitinophaga terrae (ex Kim and Jung 2007)]SEA81733.1 pyruvate dehydrogenase (quinone) [Chitinophaga terrae (ex Kim and Jung 2007)]